MDVRSLENMTTHMNMLGPDSPADRLSPMVTFLDKETVELIGHLIVAWGQLDLKLIAVTVRLLETTGQPAPIGWREQSFKRRRKLLLQLMRLQFPDQHNILRFWEKIVSAACPLHDKRSLLAHGMIEEHRDSDGLRYVVLGKGGAEHILCPDEIKAAVRELGELSARIQWVTWPLPISVPPLTEEDAQLIRAIEVPGL